MKAIYKGISNWFIGDYFRSEQDEFEKAKIKLNFNFILILFVTSIFYLIYEIIHKDFVFVVVFATSIFFVVLTAIHLKYKKSVFETSQLLSSLFLLYVVAAVLLSNGIIDLLTGVWAIVLMLYAFFALGKMGAKIFSGIIFLIFALFLSFQHYNIFFTLNHYEGPPSSEPTRYLLPFALLYYVLHQFVKNTSRAENKLKCIIEQQEGTNTSLQNNIEKLKSTKLKLEESERNFRLISQNSSDLISQHKLDGSFIYVSPSVKELLGYETTELLGRTPYALFHSDDADKIAVMHHLVRSGVQESKMQYRIRKSNGDYIWFESIIKPIKNKYGKISKIQMASRDISEIKNVEQELFELAKFPEESPHPIYRVDAFGQIIYSNKRDFDLENYIKKNLNAFLEVDVIEFINSTKGIEKQIQIKEKYYNLVLTPISDLNYINIYAKEVTERVKAQHQFQHTLIRMNELIKNLEGAVLLESERRNILLTNDKFTEMFRIPQSPAELIGKSCGTAAEEVKHLFADENQFVERVNQLLLEKEKVIGEEIEMKNGEVLERDFIPVYNKNEFIGILWHYKYITERKRAEQALKYEKELAEKSSSAKAQFLSTMSHEIRTPMNAVIGLTNILLEENPKADQLENLRTLKFSGETLLGLLNDILDFSKIEAGKLSLEKTDFNLHRLAESIKNAHSPRAKEKGIQLILRLDSDLPEKLYGDPVRLSQVMNNLTANAIKFTDEGRVMIDVIVQKRMGNQALLGFSVSDTGIGIPQNKQKTIFNSFQQANEDTTRKYGGTGLGLTITEKLLELHGSQIQIKSSPGKGSMFSFDIKYEVVQDKTSENKSGVSDSFHFRSLKGIRVLLVEDNLINQTIAKKFLQKWDLDVDVAENGLDALDKIKKNSYHIVLMDLQMPKMDGYQATMEIRKMNNGIKDIPIIALTASAMVEVQDKVHSVGMDDYIVKPFNPEELRKTLQKHLC